MENVQEIAECDVGDPIAFKRGDARAADTRQLGKPVLRLTTAAESEGEVPVGRS
jgi:hypothetical protein